MVLKNTTVGLSVVSEDEDDDEDESLTIKDVEDSSSRGSETDEIAKKQTRLVTASKLFVLLVLLLASVGCAVGTYYFTAQADRAIFESSVEDYGNELIEVSTITAQQIFTTVHSMSLTVTSFAISVNATWPYVVINHFELRGQQLLELTGSRFVSMTPFVKRENKDEWERWSVQNQGWIPPKAFPPYMRQHGISPTIMVGQHGGAGLDNTSTHYAPIWQLAPIFPPAINGDTFTQSGYDKMQRTRELTLSRIIASEEEEVNVTDIDSWPRGVIHAPIFENFEIDSPLVAQFSSMFWWHKLFQKVLPDYVTGMRIVIHNTCNQTVTYQVNGPDVQFIGMGDHHDPKYDAMEVSSPFDVLDNTCLYTIRVYPSNEVEVSYQTKNPIIYTSVVIFVFLLTSAAFILYSLLVERRQDTVMTSAQRSNAIVKNLFPAQFRDRLMMDNNNAPSNDPSNKKNSNQDVTSFLRPSNLLGGATSGLNLGSKPIADLFLECTVMFGDICGFTAWSSTREPSQVFTLLEQIYSSFDAIAKKKRIFKVETIGDCYVAAAGLPEPRSDHAEVMARFASECRTTMNRVVKQLEVILGPDTGELLMRFGLHSGPVTAGVLRGEKCRFQLFGDTVNTAARMESAGTKNMIHVSQATASLLEAAGKASWVRRRDTPITAKGKGEIQTYWLTLKAKKNMKYRESDTQSIKSDNNLSSASLSSEKEDMVMSSDDRTKRLVDWNVEVLQMQLKKIVAMRDGTKVPSLKKIPTNAPTIDKIEGQTVLDEVLEVIPLSNTAKEYQLSPDRVDLDPKVIAQLQDYVQEIASMYRDNPFHNFEHASHVTMSITKLLGRVVKHDSIDYKELEYKQNSEGGGKMHEYTYGITSDPLIHFACALSGMIHDVDHVGVPNAQLVKEGTTMAQIYRNQSVAEQNSVDLAWGLLMEPRFRPLRDYICPTQEEMNRFRHLVVNSVMATDIVDKELGALRKKRWNKAFNIGDEAANYTPSSPEEDVNRKATIVIEHLIQASDVSHTMQHWHIYLKWNERFFQECYGAYLAGRAEKDPSEGWYKGELGFFDFYIIPLAKKLKNCGVFGVSSDEYLNYALENRKEWELKGEEVVAQYLSNYHKERREGTSHSTESNEA